MSRYIYIYIYKKGRAETQQITCYLDFLLDFHNLDFLLLIQSCLEKDI